MICQHCGKTPATTRIKRIVNGQLSETAICSDCARKMGYGPLLGDWSLPLGSLLGGLMEEEAEPEIRCKGCGITFEEITRTGRVGCAQCFQTFGLWRGGYHRRLLRRRDYLHDPAQPVPQLQV